MNSHQIDLLALASIFWPADVSPTAAVGKFDEVQLG
jgi:hypothetical protein